MENKENQIATFAGGCFWCTESAFHGKEGVLKVVPGYIGGHVDHPTYEQVCSGTTGHFEAVQVTFDPDIISFQDLLLVFFQQIDPTDREGSFVDRGSQYRSAVFCHTDAQKAAAINSIGRLNDAGLFKAPVVTQILEATQFYEAEVYHQGYHEKNPDRYRRYRAGTGRDAFIERHRKTLRQILG
jgi:methionine-S-sulfoxide reductase